MKLLFEYTNSFNRRDRYRFEYRLAQH